ncbi:mei-38, partial [Drosophila busckii]
IRSCWSPISKSPTSGSENSCSAVAPRAYEFKAVYDQRRQNALRQREEEERKARQFHSRPVPNFKAMHKRLQDMIVVQKFTLPTTPETLKHSRKRQVDPNRVDEMNGKDSRAALTEVKPFQLRSEQRVRERRGFDAAMQKQLAERKQQV